MAANPEVVVKRERDEISELPIGVTDDVVEKKPKLENDVGTEAVVRLGTKEFTSSRQMFETFQGWLMPCWASVQPVDCDPMLQDLVKKGHPEPDKLIGCGVDTFQVRLHGMCSDLLTFFVVRKDGSAADFCFRSCVNNILPLPDDLKDHGRGVVAVCACLVGGGMMFLETARQREANSVVLGSAKFNSSYDMYLVFSRLLIMSPLNEALGEENAMLLDLLKKGDPEWEKKTGSSDVESFQVRIHPGFGGDLRSFYFVRGDGSMEDFCFIKCIEHIFPSTMADSERYQYPSPCSCHHEEDGEGVVTLGWKKFRSSAEMVSYFESSNERFPFYNHTDPFTKQIEQTAMLSLLKKGDPETWEKKMGSGSGVDIQSVERQRHPNIGVWHPLFGVVRKDGPVEYFCYKKCIDNLFPPPMGHKRLCSTDGDCTVNSRPRRSNGGRGRGRGRGGQNNMELQVQNQQEQIEILNKWNDARQEYIHDLQKYIKKNGLPPPPPPASPLLNFTQVDKENDVKEEKMY